MGSFGPRQKKIVITIVAAAVALAAFLFTVSQTRSSSSSGQQVQVVAAATDLPASTKLGPDNLISLSVPSANFNASAMYNYSDVSKVSGQYLAVSANKNVPITSNELVTDSSNATVVTAKPFSIKDGDVAISVPFDETKGVGGYVQPEDHLDILVDRGTGDIHYDFQDIRVLKVGGHSQQAALTSANGGASSAPSSTIPTLLVVEMPRQQAASMAYLLNGNGGRIPASIVRFVLRPYGSYGKGVLPNSNAATAATWQSALSG